MEIGIVRMSVPHRRMRVPVRVRLAHRHRVAMLVLVMLVMAVRVLVRERRMDVLMVVVFGQVQPDAEPHECGGDEERRCRCFAERHDGAECTDERRGCEIGAGPTGAEMT